MATYYVRKSGNDGNTGLSPAQAWLTVDHAANNVVADDTVHIGAGIYRERVTIDTSGSSGSPIKWVADITGENTGDGGLVYITPTDSEVGATGDAGPTLDLNAKLYNEFYSIIFGPGGTGAADQTVEGEAGNCTYEGVLFDTCVILPPLDSGNACLGINYGDPPAVGGAKLRLIDCVLLEEIRIIHGAMVTADRACGAVLENCIIFSTGDAIYLDGPSSNTYGITGYEIQNCTYFSPAGLYVSDHFGAGVTGIAANNVIPSNGRCVQIAADGGTWTLSNNMTLNETAETGATSKCTTLLGFMVDNILQKNYGWSPYKAFEPVYDAAGSGFKAGPIEQASATYAPAADIYGNPRPMNRNADDVGAAEARARGRDETGTVYADSHSMLVAGAGYHDMIVPVAAELTTVTVQARYDGNYTGSLPLLEVLNIPGVADQSDVMTAAADNWEKLTCAFTPTSAGYVRVRLRSRDTSANGEAFFDAVEVS